MRIAVSISFSGHLVAEIDKLAKKEKRSRSELIGDAVRLYIGRRDRWNKIFAMGKAAVKNKELSERDVAAEIQAHRKT